MHTEWYPCVVFEPLNPYGMVPISTPNIYKVIDNLHMLWMRIWIHHYAVTTTLARLCIPQLLLSNYSVFPFTAFQIKGTGLLVTEEPIVTDGQTKGN